MDSWKYSPAQDRGLSVNERLKSPRRESGLVGVVTRNVWWTFLRAYFATCQNLAIHGRENLPRNPPLILAANHQSHLDALVVALALPLRLRNCVFPIAAGDTFFEAPAARVFAAAALNALPLWRHNAGRHAIELLRTRLVEEPCGYLLFPEGTRSRSGQMARFRPGIGMLAAGTGVPVVPCHIEGTFQALPPDRRMPRRARLVVRIGKPLAFDGLANTRESWNQIAAEVEEAVRGLAGAAS